MIDLKQQMETVEILEEGEPFSISGDVQCWLWHSQWSGSEVIFLSVFSKAMKKCHTLQGSKTEALDQALHEGCYLQRSEGAAVCLLLLGKPHEVQGEVTWKQCVFPMDGWISLNQAGDK